MKVDCGIALKSIHVPGEVSRHARKADGGCLALFLSKPAGRCILAYLLGGWGLPDARIKIKKNLPGRGAKLRAG